MGLRDYLMLYGYLIKNNIMAQMQFRINFFMSVLVEIAFLMAKSLYIIVIFSVGKSINGLSAYQMLMFIGSYTLITGVMDAVYYPNIVAIPEYVRSGDMDLYLTKPISAQFLVSFRKFDIGLGIPNVLAGIVMIIVSWISCGIPVSFSYIIGYTYFTFIGCVVTYPILLIPVTLSFWLVKTTALNDMIWALWDFNNMPMAIYNRSMQMIGTFIIPIFLVTNFAPLFVMDMLSGTYIVFSIFVAPLFILLSILFWNFAIKFYSSASS